MLQNTLNLMFSTIGLFRTVECPEIQQCQLPNCIFSHQKPSRGKRRDLTQVSGDVELGNEDSIGLDDGPRKKRRMSSPVNDDDAAEAETKEKTQNRELHDKTLKVGVRRTEVDRKTVHITASGNISPPPFRGVKLRPGDFVKGKHGENYPTTPKKTPRSGIVGEEGCCRALESKNVTQSSSTTCDAPQASYHAS